MNPKTCQKIVKMETIRGRIEHGSSEKDEASKSFQKNKLKKEATAKDALLTY